MEYKKEVVSPLLYKAFKDKESANEYYDELNSIIKCKNLDKIRDKCQNWGQIEDRMRTNWGQIGTCIEETRYYKMVLWNDYQKTGSHFFECFFIDFVEKSNIIIVNLREKCLIWLCPTSRSGLKITSY